MVERSIIVRKALERGFAEVRLEIAAGMFSKGKLSTSEAAEIAGLSRGETYSDL